MKKCPSCKQTKSDNDFYRRSSGNLTSWCCICINAYQKAKVETPEGREALKERQKKWRETNRTKSRQQRKDRNHRQRREVIDAYGGRCDCCGESEELFLTVDHIEGRNEDDDYKSTRMYAYLVKQGFPKGYTILCFNCNCGRSRNGGTCPHLGATLP